MNDLGKSPTCKQNNIAILLKTITWLSFTLATEGFGFVQCCYPILLLPSFLTFGLFCNRKLCHFFNWQGLAQHLQAQKSELEFKTPLLQARAPLSREQLIHLFPKGCCCFREESKKGCWTLSSLLRSSFLSWLHGDTRKVHCIKTALQPVTGGGSKRPGSAPLFLSPWGKVGIGQLEASASHRVPELRQSTRHGWRAEQKAQQKMCLMQWLWQPYQVSQFHYGFIIFSDIKFLVCFQKQTNKSPNKTQVFVKEKQMASINHKVQAKKKKNCWPAGSKVNCEVAQFYSMLSISRVQFTDVEHPWASSIFHSIKTHPGHPMIFSVSLPALSHF